jgi:hypothetical protein
LPLDFSSERSDCPVMWEEKLKPELLQLLNSFFLNSFFSNVRI